MLSAAGRLAAVSGQAGSWSLVPLGASLLVHAAVMAALLVRVVPAAMDEPPPVEVEMVQQIAQVRGAPAVPPAARVQNAPAVPPATPDAPAPTPPESPAGGVRVARLLPPAPPRPTPPAAPAPEVNLGTGAQDLDALIVTSKDLVPAAPDSRYRNVPPGYPAEAARIGAEGIVQLVIHVSTAGLASEVVVARSSGFESLDQAAKRAVQLWRFRPARNGDRAVPFDYLLNIRFTAGDSR